jgi:hypothetical protein
MKLIEKKRNDGAVVPKLKVTRARALLKQLPGNWKINGRGHLERLYTFEDFAQGLAFEEGRGCRRGPEPSSRCLSGLGQMQG